MSSAATIAIPARSTPIPIHGYSHDLYPMANSHTAPTVFVVDHDIHIRQSLELLIRSQCWQPQTCDSVSEFLARPRPSVPSCLILAFSSTDSNGLEVQKRIAKECADTPIVIIADYGDIPTTVQAMNRQVGVELGISEITVKAHRGNVMRKMKADSFAHLVNMATRLRLVRYLTTSAA
jgi:FixJ family two-component response regulator